MIRSDWVRVRVVVRVEWGLVEGGGEEKKKKEKKEKEKMYNNYNVSHLSSLYSCH